MKKFTVLMVQIGIAVIAFLPTVSAQKVHPKKKAFQDVASWPTISPDQVELKNFAPFRAVYDRTYRQGSGANSGDLRKDRVIISAEEAGWGGRMAIVISLIDSGIAEHKDTNARALTMIVDREDLSVLFEIGPVPGKAKDYYIARVEKDAVLVSGVMTRKQQLKTESTKTKKPGFGPSVWALASKGLRKGEKIKLSPNYSPDENLLTVVNTGHIIAQRTFKDGSGVEHDAWVLETTKSVTSPKVKHVYLIDKPPYYLGQETVDLDTGERKPFVWLRNVDLFDQPANEISNEEDSAAESTTERSNASLDREMIKKGLAIYEQGMCAKCHGQDGTGSRLGPDLTDDVWHHCDGSANGIRGVLDSGISKSNLHDKSYSFGMNPATNLIKDEADLEVLSQYVLSLIDK